MALAQGGRPMVKASTVGELRRFTNGRKQNIRLLRYMRQTVTAQPMKLNSYC